MFLFSVNNNGLLNHSLVDFECNIFNFSKVKPIDIVNER